MDFGLDNSFNLIFYSEQVLLLKHMLGHTLFLGAEH